VGFVLWGFRFGVEGFGSAARRASRGPSIAVDVATRPGGLCYSAPRETTGYEHSSIAIHKLTSRVSSANSSTFAGTRARCRVNILRKSLAPPLSYEYELYNKL